MSLPDDFSEKWLVLFSHSADFTAVCTTGFVSFAKRHAEFRKLNCELIGLSMDPVFSHIKWIEWIEEKLGVEIQFPIIADTGIVANKLGMIHPGAGTNTVRAVFIIDPKGVIRLILFYPATIGRNMEGILRVVKAFQVSDKNGVAIPANWPNNELMKDEVIIPPPIDIKTAKERINKSNYYDWWPCHKKL
jgi:peroxiredoxin (alkyl hydroperoxide reductase subunit C)